MYIYIYYTPVIQDPTKRPSFQDVVDDLEAEVEAAESSTEL